MNATKGPWMAEGAYVWGPVDTRSKHANGRTLVARTVHGSESKARGYDDGAWDEESRANAVLLAAAPELLAALRDVTMSYEALLRATGNDEHTPSTNWAHAIMRKAVKP